jgi:uracil-DNA glycosylase family 4
MTTTRTTITDRAMRIGRSPAPSGAEPPRDCPACPRLAAFRDHWRAEEPSWHNAPVPTWADARGDEHVRLLIVGLAPCLRGANRTGRPFTGDYAGELLYSTLEKFGFASGDYAADPHDGLTLNACAITNSVRCVPPQNKPVGEEIGNCRSFLVPTLRRFSNLTAVLTLGRIAHESTLRALALKPADAPFAHGAVSKAGGLSIFSSYHCSRYNTNTNRLTPQMFTAVFDMISGEINGPRPRG